jgi:hypothetical protein
MTDDEILYFSLSTPPTPMQLMEVEQIDDLQDK